MQQHLASTVRQYAALLQYFDGPTTYINGSINTY